MTAQLDVETCDGTKKAVSSVAGAKKKNVPATSMSTRSGNAKQDEENDEDFEDFEDDVRNDNEEEDEESAAGSSDTENEEKDDESQGESFHSANSKDDAGMDLGSMRKLSCGSESMTLKLFRAKLSAPNFKFQSTRAQ